MKITKKIKIKNCDSLRLFKRKRSKYWYAGIVVPRTVKLNCFLFKSLRTTDTNEAKIKGKEFWFEHIAKDKTKTPPDLIFDYFFEKYLNDLRERVSLDEVYPTLLRATTSRYESEIKPIIGRLNIREISTDHLNKLKFNLIAKRKEYKTIKNYFTIIRQTFKIAFGLNAVELTPSFPKLKKKKSSPYVPYKKEEIHLITKELRKVPKTEKKYEHYDEVADIVNFLYFVPLRPGREFLSLTHNDVKIISSIKGDILVIDPPVRKVEKFNQPIPSHPIAKDMYEKRICKRYPNKTGNEFLFFNNAKKRKSLQKIIYKIFRKISSKLGLYVVDENAKRHRPLYSLRSSNFIETYAKSGNLDLTSRVGNSSPKQLNDSYLRKFSEEKIVEIYSKLYA